MDRACSKCNELKPEDQFYWKKRGKQLYKHCKSCHYVMTKAWAAGHNALRNERARNYQRIAKYGITQAEWLAVCEAVDYHCQLCGVIGEASRAQDRTPGMIQLNLDHDHKTGKNRGVLCSNCNLALGNFRDDPDLMERAAAYVRKHASTMQVEELASLYGRG